MVFPITFWCTAIHTIFNPPRKISFGPIKLGIVFRPKARKGWCINVYRQKTRFRSWHTHVMDQTLYHAHTDVLLSLLHIYILCSKFSSSSSSSPQQALPSSPLNKLVLYLLPFLVIPLPLSSIFSFILCILSFYFFFFSIFLFFFFSPFQSRRNEYKRLVRLLVPSLYFFWFFCLYFFLFFFFMLFPFFSRDGVTL